MGESTVPAGGRGTVLSWAAVALAVSVLLAAPLVVGVLVAGLSGAGVVDMRSSAWGHLCWAGPALWLAARVGRALGRFAWLHAGAAFPVTRIGGALCGAVVAWPAAFGECGLVVRGPGAVALAASVATAVSLGLSGLLIRRAGRTSPTRAGDPSRP